MPTTGFANSPVDTANIIKMVGGAPLVIKLLEGTQGKGVVLAEKIRRQRGYQCLQKPKTKYTRPRIYSRSKW